MELGLEVTPARHMRIKNSLKPWSMSALDEVSELVNHHILDAFDRLFDELQVEQHGLSEGVA